MMYSAIHVTTVLLCSILFACAEEARRTGEEAFEVAVEVDSVIPDSVSEVSDEVSETRDTWDTSAEVEAEVAEVEAEVIETIEVEVAVEVAVEVDAEVETTEPDAVAETVEAEVVAEVMEVDGLEPETDEAEVAIDAADEVAAVDADDVAMDAAAPDVVEGEVAVEVTLEVAVEVAVEVEVAEETQAPEVEAAEETQAPEVEVAAEETQAPEVETAETAEDATPEVEVVVDTTPEAEVVVPNQSPVLVGPTLAAVVVGDHYTCVASASDPDGDVVALTYTWSFTRDGVTRSLAATGTTLLNRYRPDDTVTCTASATDGVAAIGRSISAQSANAGTIIGDGGPRITWTDDGPDAGDTLRCDLHDPVDPEGDAFTLTYTWEVAGEVVASGDGSSLAGVFAKGDIVRCLVDDGIDTHVAAVEIINHIPSCSPTFGQENTTVALGSALTCGCREGSVDDADGDLIEEPTCTWTDRLMGGVLATGCSLSSDAIAGRFAKCNVTLDDGEATWTGDVGFNVEGGRDTFTWPSPAVAISPASVAIDTLDTALTCSWNRSAVAASGKSVFYYVAWRKNGATVLHGNDSNNTITTLRALGVSTTDDSVTCNVAASTGYVDIFGATQQSARLGLMTGARVSGLTASHADSVPADATFVCSGTTSGGATISVQSSSDATTWTDLDVTSVTGSPAKWLRCSAEAAVQLTTTSAVRVLNTPLEVGPAVVSPILSEPCDARNATVWLRDGDAVAGYPSTVSVTATWTVDGVVGGSDSVQAELGAGFAGVTIPMSAAAPDGATIVASISAAKPGLAPKTMSAEGYVDGTGPTLEVTLPTLTRVGDDLTCAVVANGTCAEATTLSYRWLIDGVLTDQTGATFDSNAYHGTQVVTCVASIGSTASGAGGTAFAAASSTRLAPSFGTVRGADLNGYLGQALAIGDFDGDGQAELAVGAPNASPAGRGSAGRVYVVEGETGRDIELNDVLDGSDDGVVIDGDSGSWVATDTICRPRTPNILVSCNPGVAGWDAESNSEAPLGDGFGTRLVSIGDVDGDGRHDLLASAPYAHAHGQYLAGRSYLVPGSALDGVFRTTIGTLTTAAGAAWEGEQGVWPSKLYSNSGVNFSWDGHNAGFGLASGDFDGDGVPDVAIGAPFVDGNGQNAGRVYQVSGSSSGWLGTLTTGTVDEDIVAGRAFDGRTQVSYQQGQVGGVLSSVGDFDGDGYDDLLIGDNGWSEILYLVPGRAAFADGSLTRLQDATDVRRFVVDDYDYGLDITTNPLAVTAGKLELSSEPAGVGDVNGDGKDDIAVPFVEYEGQGQIELAVFFGSDDVGDFDIDGPDAGIGGFVVEGRPAGQTIKHKARVHRVGDLDGDGKDDIALSLERADGAHLVYVIYGRATTTSATLADIEAGIGGYVTQGLSRVGAVTGGDLDGDGRADLVIGSPAFYYFVANAGLVHIEYSRGPDVFGDETLEGSVLYGGTGDDRLIATTIERVDGGLGDDTLVTGTTDLAAVRGRIRGVERIEVNGTLSLTARDLVRLSDTSNQLVVTGTGRVDVLDAGWAFDADTTIDGVTIAVLVSGHARLLVAADLELRVAPRLVTTSLTVAEGATGPIGVLATEDADGDTVAPSLTDPRFTLSGRVLLVASALDFEATPTVVLPITLTDGDGLVTFATLTVVVSDVPEAPSFVADTTASIPEGATNGRTLLVARAVDPEGAAVTYTWVSETHAGLTGRRAFDVDATTGRVYVRDGTWLDYETAPEVTLVVRATDPGGLHDDLTITIALSDDVVITRTQTVPFFAENRGLWDANGSISAHTAWKALPAVDLDSDLDHGDVQIASPLDDTAYDIGGGVSGSIGIDVDASFNDGYVSAYLPIALTTALPDDVALGVPFSIATDWALDSGAAIWGETPSIEATINFDFADIGGVFDAIGGGPSSTYAIDDGAFALSFEVQSKVFTGASFATSYPDGLDLFAPTSADGAPAYWVYDLANTAVAAQYLVTGAPQRLYLGQLLLDPGESVDDYTDPDLVVSSFAQDTFLEADLDQTKLLGALGLPNAQVTPWQGTVSLPFTTAGKGEIVYDLWSTRLKSAAYYGNQFATRVEAVRGTLVFEDGTTVSGSLRDGFTDITLPQGADVDGDGRVSFVMTIDIDARFSRLWSYDVTVRYLSDMLKGRLYTYMREIDYRTGQLADDFTLIKNEGFGPVRHTEADIGLFSDLGRGDWLLEGFESVVATGALQIRR